MWFNLRAPEGGPWGGGLPRETGRPWLRSAWRWLLAAAVAGLLVVLTILPTLADQRGPTAGPDPGSRLGTAR